MKMDFRYSDAVLIGWYFVTMYMYFVLRDIQALNFKGMLGQNNPRPLFPQPSLADCQHSEIESCLKPTNKTMTLLLYLNSRSVTSVLCRKIDLSETIITII